MSYLSSVVFTSWSRVRGWGFEGLLGPGVGDWLR